MKYNSQMTSTPRVQVDVLGNNALSLLYTQYKVMELEEFRALAKGIISESVGSKAKKATFNMMLDTLRTKEAIMTKLQNYILAGMGLGV